MIQTDLPIIGICAYSGTGKTTLLTRLIPLLKAEGLRLTVIKHGHHALELDQPGKDSYKFRAAGADQVVLVSSKRAAIMQECHTQQEPSLQESLKFVNRDCADLILVEGFKHEHYPKIELHRPALHKPLLFPTDPYVVALATDGEPELPRDARALPRLDINQPASFVRFIMDTVINKSSANQSGAPQIRTAASCADAREPGSLSLDEARSRILGMIQPLATPLKRALRDALGQVLAEDVISPVNVPAHTNSAMDGYALAGTDLPTDTLRSYRIIGSLFAGQTFEPTCQPGECVRIMTGAPMPAGTDTVVMQEHAQVTGDGRVSLGSGERPGQNVRQAGEDIALHARVLTAGRRITPADLGLLASLGIAEVKVQRAPRVAFFSTGDELRSLGEPLGKGCVYDSNRYTLYGMLKQLGMDILDLGVVADDPAALTAAFQTAASNADVVITSGGVSVGEADFTKQILGELGTINFWKIAIKPGRPLACGKLGAGDTLFFGLPGNPVAVMVTFDLLVKPALLKLAGEQTSEPIHEPLRVQAVCTERLRKKPGRTECLRAILKREPNGTLSVARTGQQGSGVLTSMSHANAYILLPEENAGVAMGDTVTVQPFGDWSSRI